MQNNPDVLDYLRRLILLPDNSIPSQAYPALNAPGQAFSQVADYLGMPTDLVEEVKNPTQTMLRNPMGPVPGWAMRLIGQGFADMPRDLADSAYKILQGQGQGPLDYLNVADTVLNVTPVGSAIPPIAPMVGSISYGLSKKGIPFALKTGPDAIEAVTGAIRQGAKAGTAQQLLDSFMAVVNKARRSGIEPTVLSTPGDIRALGQVGRDAENVLGASDTATINQLTTGARDVPSTLVQALTGSTADTAKLGGKAKADAANLNFLVQNTNLRAPTLEEQKALARSFNEVTRLQGAEELGMDPFIRILNNDPVYGPQLKQQMLDLFRTRGGAVTYQDILDAVPANLRSFFASNPRLLEAAYIDAAQPAFNILGKSTGTARSLVPDKLSASELRAWRDITKQVPNVPGVYRYDQYAGKTDAQLRKRLTNESHDPTLVEAIRYFLENGKRGFETVPMQDANTQFIDALIRSYR